MNDLEYSRLIRRMNSIKRESNAVLLLELTQDGWLSVSTYGEPQHIAEAKQIAQNTLVLGEKGGEA